MTPYSPDRILVWILSGRNPYDDKLPVNAVPWDQHSLSLAISPSETPSEKIIYVDGTTAKEIYMMFDGANGGIVFTQAGKEYTVYVDIVLPHEKVTNAYQ
jgi:hypothetical protein